MTARDRQRETDAREHADPACAPVFRRCVRCGYSLRGLAANGQCPECGLRFDERCALYRVTNPRQVLVLLILIFTGGWISLKRLPHLVDLTGASAWDTVGSLVAILWVVLVATGLWFVVKRYRRGFAVAITGDGLIARLPGFREDLIPWRDIRSAAIQEHPADKPQVASLLMRDADKTVRIGGVVNVFPDRATVQRFVDEVNARVGAVVNRADPAAG